MRNQRRRRDCRSCGRLAGECGPLSARGLCADCSMTNMVENCLDPSQSVPDYWERWRRGMAASVGLDFPEKPPIQD